MPKAVFVLFSGSFGGRGYGLSALRTIRASLENVRLTLVRSGWNSYKLASS